MFNVQVLLVGSKGSPKEFRFVLSTVGGKVQMVPATFLLLFLQQILLLLKERILQKSKCCLMI